MEYLLVDFGASCIKCCIYDTTTQQFSKDISYESPFTTRTTLDKRELLIIINNIQEQFNCCKRVLSCSILGGEWVNDTYFSWKALKTKTKPDSLISGLFIDSPEYHIHKHHGGPSEHIMPLGFIQDVLWYSDLGDTDCVINAIDWSKSDQYVINIGTGSQVISQDTIYKYIPAGRALLVFHQFFNSIGFDFFAHLNKLSLEEIVNSNLTIDLNIFEQAHLYDNGGMIGNITEYNFSIKNMLGSIIRTLVCQYQPFIQHNNWLIKLTGGIPTKLPVMRAVFEYYYQNPIVVSNNIEAHIGLAKFADTIIQ